MAKILQPSLSGGELSPGMRGRVDLARYAISLGLARNFNTKPTGGGAKRSGTIFRGRVKFSNRKTRLIPFVYSTQVRYLIEMGHGYMRFWTNGSLLTSVQRTITGISVGVNTVVTAPAHGFVNGDQVVIYGVRGSTKLNFNTFTVINATTNTFELAGANTVGVALYAGGGIAGKVVEVPTPYDENMIWAVRFTQSADVLYLVHGQVTPRELRRTSITSFEMRDFPFKRGPFRPNNSNDAYVMAASAPTGQVTITCNTDVFSEAMIGSLIYLEEQELRGVKPWASAEKNVAIGQLRRRDGKIYRAVSIPASLGSAGAPYYVTGAQAPTHESGRAFDGPQDIKFDGVNDYAVGVEWEFLHNVFGIARIDAYTDTKTVTATVIERLPDSITGTAPAPGNTWNIAGDGSNLSYAIAGASSPSNSSYTVTINGVPVQSNPSYGGGDPVDEWCVDANSVIPGGTRAGQVEVGSDLPCYNNKPDEPGVVMLEVKANAVAPASCMRLVTSSGASIVASITTPMTLRDGSCIMFPYMLGHEALVMRGGAFAWEEVVSLENVGTRPVAKISVSDQCYFAGEVDGVFIATHNVQQQKP